MTEMVRKKITSEVVTDDGLAELLVEVAQELAPETEMPKRVEAAIKLHRSGVHDHEFTEAMDLLYPAGVGAMDSITAKRITGAIQ